MATRWGAEAIGLGDVTGSIEMGKAADIVLADVRKPHLSPMYDPYSSIVYSMSAADVDSVIVDGKLVLNRRTLTTGDEQAILNRASDWGHRIAKKSG